MSDDDPIRKWASVKAAIREATKKVYAEYGVTYEGLLELEEQALTMLGNDETVQTEYGTVYVNETPCFIHKHSEPFGTVKHLKLSRKA